MSVDEAMVTFKGRSTLKQYMPLKPVKRGIKVWALADASNGYISNFKVYTGKDGDKAEKGLGANVVMTLTEPYVNAMYTSTTISPALIFSILKNQICMVVEQ